MSRSRLTQHDAYIREAAASGTTSTNIARSLGVPPTTVRSYMERHRISVTAAPLATPDTDRPSEVEILRAQLAEARAAVRTASKADVAEERVVQAIEAAVAQARAPEQVWLTAVDPTSSAELEDAHHRQVLCLSDFHGGEVVDAEAVNYHNAYDWAIMQERITETIDAALSHKRNSPSLTGLDVLFIGDMCSGSNHEELAETNEFPLAEQAIRMGYVQADIIRRFAPHYPEIRVGVVVGNHPRLQKKPAAKRVHDNGDWIAGTVMAEALRDLDTVHCTVSRSAALLWEIAGRTMFVWHGDGIRSSMPGVPWGGVMRRVNAIQARQRVTIDHFVCGHYHQANVVGAGRIIMNGALKGTDEWVEKSFGGGDPPTQLLLTFDEKAQRMTDQRYITPTAGLPE